MEVINALMRNTIDLKRATLILRALHIAVKNASRVKFGLEKSNMVRDIPQYEEEPAARAAEAVHASGTSVAGARAVALGYPTVADAATELDLPAVAASEPKPVTPDSEFLKNWEAGGIELKRQAAARQAAAAAAAMTTTAPGLPNNDFKPQPTQSAARTTQPAANSTTPKPEAPPHPPRKPAASAPAAPKERKNAAQHTSAG